MTGLTDFIHDSDLLRRLGQEAINLAKEAKHSEIRAILTFTSGALWTQYASSQQFIVKKTEEQAKVNDNPT